MTKLGLKILRREKAVPVKGGLEVVVSASWVDSRHVTQDSATQTRRIQQYKYIGFVVKPKIFSRGR